MKQLAVRWVHRYRNRPSAATDMPVCRMAPSCSTYALQALDQHSTAVALWLVARRLLRCRPGGPVGTDLVPAPRARSQVIRARFGDRQFVRV